MARAPLTRRPSLLGRIWLRGGFLRWQLNPMVYGPGAAEALLVSRLILLASSPAPLLVIGGIQGLAVALLLVGASLMVHKLFDAVRGPGIDGETPSLALYLLPYAWSMHTIADLIARLSEGRVKGFKWVRLEAVRLKLFLDNGLDPLRALQKLAETTPSKSLRIMLEELSHASKVGYSRSSVMMRLAERALEDLKKRWSSYSELAKVISEVNAALIVAIGALAPLAMFTGMSVGILYASLLLPGLLSIALVLLQPPSGPGRISWLSISVTIVGAAVASWISYRLGAFRGILVLLPLSLGLEVYGVLHSRTIDRAFRALTRASREARLGRPIEALLREAEPLDAPVIGTIRESVRIAGMSKVWFGVEALERAYREARRALEALRGSAFMALAVSILAILTALYSISAVSGIAVKIAPQSLEVAYLSMRVLSGVAPLAGLPAGVLLRPRSPSLAPSLTSLLLLWASRPLLSHLPMPTPLS
jgi:hypothetical protein